MRPFAVAALLAVLFVSAPALADPGVTTRYENGLLRVTLNGSYPGRYYQVWRSGELLGEYRAMSYQPTLCTGDCFLTDIEARPGAVYYYRFVLQTPEGSLREYGPYAVTVPDTPIGVRVSPNPTSGDARIELSVPGSSRRDAPVQALARIVDLQGRTVRMLHSGPLARGVTPVHWDGRGDAGQSLGAGVYFVHLSTPLGASITRVVRIR